MQKENIVIVSASRTPMGSFQGSLSKIPATTLGSIVIKKNLEDTKLNPADVDEVIMGCVLSAGLGQAPARQASIGAKIPPEVGATTINKMCGSGMKAIMIGNDSILAGNNNIVLAGGLESMSNAPFVLQKVREGIRMGHSLIKDHMFVDGLEDAYDKGKLMGCFAEDTAEYYQFTREEQDNFAIQSLERAKKATEKGIFKDEISPIEVVSKKHKEVINRDEQPFKSNINKIPFLKPAFKANGTVTAANSSSISDGASSIMIMKESEAEKRNIKPWPRCKITVFYKI